MENDNLIFEVYHQGMLLGKCKTSERHDLIRKNLSKAQIDDIEAGDIEFRLVSFL